MFLNFTLPFISITYNWLSPCSSCDRVPVEPALTLSICNWILSYTCYLFLHKSCKNLLICLSENPCICVRLFKFLKMNTRLDFKVAWIINTYVWFTLMIIFLSNLFELHAKMFSIWKQTSHYEFSLSSKENFMKIWSHESLSLKLGILHLSKWTLDFNPNKQQQTCT